LKKKYFLILSLILLILTVSYVNANDDLNSTDSNVTAENNSTE